MAKDCPACGLINDDTAESCDCGYNFHNDPDVNKAWLKKLENEGRFNMFVGAILFLIGAVSTLLTIWSSVTEGFFSYAFYGLIIFGGSLGVRGWEQKRRARKGRDQYQ